MIDTPKLRVPISLSGSGFAAVEQDSPGEIFQCVEAVVRTTTGSRIDFPSFGVPDYTFTDLTDTDAILEAIEEFEPRADESVTDRLDTITVGVRMKEEN